MNGINSSLTQVVIDYCLNAGIRFIYNRISSFVNQNFLSLFPRRQEIRRHAAMSIQRTFRSHAQRKIRRVAARTIQRAWRQYKIQKNRKQNRAAITIQRAYREHQERKERFHAATTIQQACQLYAHRQEKEHLLPLSLFIAARSLIVSNQAANLPRAANGKSPVYLPSHLPVVLKQGNSKARLEKTIQARELCKANQFSSLVVPTIRLHGNFVIESRLPLPSLEQKHQIGLYLEHREAFTNAVREFTRFLCQAHLEDLSGQTREAWACLCKTSIPRYDNVALYLDPLGEGKIGLIDLETFSPAPKEQSKLSACLAAIRLFPRHFEEILAVAKEFDSRIEETIEYLREEQVLMLEYFDAVYQSHRAFCEKNGIVPTAPPQPIQLTAEDRERLTSSILLAIEGERKHLPKIHSANDMQFLQLLSTLEPQQKAIFVPPDSPWAQFESTLAISDEAVRQLREEAIPELCKGAAQILQAAVSSNYQENPPGCYPSMLSARTLVFDQKSHVHMQLKKECLSRLESISFENDWQKEYLAQIVMKILFTEMQVMGKIASYNPKFGFHSNLYQVIFY